MYRRFRSDSTISLCQTQLLASHQPLQLEPHLEVGLTYLTYIVNTISCTPTHNDIDLPMIVYHYGPKSFFEHHKIFCAGHCQFSPSPIVTYIVITRYPDATMVISYEAIPRPKAAKPWSES
jgi:hypothetical protein